MNQRERVINHLKQFGSITSLEATQQYGIMRLSERVREINKRYDNYAIRSITETGKNRYGKMTRYTRYSFISTTRESKAIQQGLF